MENSTYFFCRCRLFSRTYPQPFLFQAIPVTQSGPFLLHHLGWSGHSSPSKFIEISAHFLMVRRFVDLNTHTPSTRGLYSSRFFNCLPTSGFHQKYPSTLVSNQNVVITPLIIDFYYIFKLNIYLQASIVLYKNCKN